MNDYFSIPLRLNEGLDDMNLMSARWLFFKRVIDLIGSVLGIIIFSPIIIIASLVTWLSSDGPIFYFQERLGLKGKRFLIIKFRSMIETAELDGPQLSSKSDIRVTKWGKVMRRWRIDEMPQLFNILSGDMSIVGPRPEREYYVDLLVKDHPDYKKLLNVKPGLTSLGMVRFGYAENADEMAIRMKYDLAYVNSMSFLNDIKIILLSFRLILSGKGR